MISFEIPGKPQPKQRARAARTKTGIRHYTPKQTESYEAKVGWIAQQHLAGSEPSSKPFELRLIIWVKIPDSWPQWKRRAAERGEIAATTTFDADNVLKSIKDALNGVVYRDDRQVVSGNFDKVFHDTWGAKVELYELNAQPAQLARRPAAWQ